jgi:hypothetical protein
MYWSTVVQVERITRIPWMNNTVVLKIASRSTSSYVHDGTVGTFRTRSSVIKSFLGCLVDRIVGMKTIPT